MKTLTAESAAMFLNIHKTTLTEMAAKGIIPAAKIGRAYIFSEEDLAIYVRKEIALQTAERRQNAAAATPQIITNTCNKRPGRKSKARPDLSVY